MQLPDDAALLARIATRDAEALRLLHEQYHPVLRRYLWRRLHGDAGAIDDALQEIFLNIWRFAASYRGQAKVSTWIFQIAYRQVLRARRDRPWDAPEASMPLTDADEGLVYEALSAPSPEETVVDRETLTEALRQLSGKHREVLELVFSFGFSPDEVASILAIPPGTVKSRISYARRSLLHILANQSAQEARS